MKDRRRKNFVERAFQLRIIVAYALSCAAGMFLCPGIFYISAIRELDALKWKMTFRSDPVTEMILPALLLAGVISVIFIAATLFIVSRQFKTQTAKSAEKIMGDLQTIAGGNLSDELKSGEQYFFKNVSRELSLTVAALRSRLMKTHKNFATMKHMIDTLPDIKEELLPQKCSELKTRAHEMRRSSTTD